MAVPTEKSGVSRPSNGTYHASRLGARYDVFGSERYVLALDNRALRDIAQYAPYEFIEMGTPLPTPWPKAEYEEYSRGYQKQRAALRAANAPESAMNALFREDLERTNALFAHQKYHNVVGAFEGANYEASGYFRPAMQCIMFDRSEQFCPVCRDGISDIIDLYAGHR